MKTKTNTLFYFFLLTFAFILCPLSFILVSCNTTEPPPPVNGNGNDKPKPKITLTVDDTSPTEVWFNLITENISLPDTLKLIRNNDTVKTIELSDSSFVIYDDSLLPSQSYSYQVSSIEYQVSSEPVTAVTMDTTSHNFTWEVFEFGEHGNSVLRDVAIIDENNIWAVGAIYLKDSTGANDSKAYNVLHWDGSEWELSRATNVPLNAIYAFSNEDIWAFSSAPYHYDGETWTPHNITGLFDGYVYGVWGTSSSDIYIVGGNGSIAHYNGTSWRKMESCTDVDLRDVWGDAEGNIWICGYSSDFSKTVLLYYDGSQSHIVYEGNPSEYQNEDYIGLMRRIWVSAKGKVYVLNQRFLSRIEIEPYKFMRITPYAEEALYGLRMREKNEGVMVGVDGVIGIYNGRGYKEEKVQSGNDYTLYGADIKEGLAVAVGVKIINGFYLQGVITIGK